MYSFLGIITLILTAFMLITLLVFFISVFAYRQGLKDGRALANNARMDKIIKQPKAGRSNEKTTDEKALDDSFAEGLSNICNYYNRHRVKEGDNNA